MSSDQGKEVPRALPVAIREACGIPGETFADFKKEYLKLTDQDKADFRDWLIADGWNIKA